MNEPHTTCDCAWCHLIEMNTKFEHLKQSLEIKNKYQVGRESNDLNLNNRGEIRLPPISFFFDKNIILPQLSDLYGSNINNMSDHIDADDEECALEDLIAWDAAVLTREMMGILDSHPPVLGSEQPHMPSGLTADQEATYRATYFSTFMNLAAQYRTQFELWFNETA